MLLFIECFFSKHFSAHIQKLLLVGSVVSAINGMIIYYHVIKKRGSISSSLVAFGVVIPLALAIPLYIVKLLDVRNAAFIFAMAGTAPLTPFHCFEGERPQNHSLHGLQFEFDLIELGSFCYNSSAWNVSSFCRKGFVALPVISHICC